MNNSEIIIYQTEDGQTKIQTRLEDETVWLMYDQISELIQRKRSVLANISKMCSKKDHRIKIAMCKICILVVLIGR